MTGDGAVFGVPSPVLVVAAAASVAAFAAYGWDKSAAGRGARRVPEATLHALGLIGGWPGALLAQRVFRHKTRKVSFQVVSWLTAAAHAGAVWLLVRATR